MKKSLVLTSLSAAVLAGCATSPGYETRTPLRTQTQKATEERAAAPSVLAPVQKVVQDDKAYVPVFPRKVSEHSWLRAQRVTVQTGKDPVPMSEVLRALSRQGITITSELPLDRFTYSGFSLNDVDAESALRAVVATVGLDYEADASRRLVTIKPLSTRTWYLNIGNRRSTFAAGNNSAGGPSMSNGVAKMLANKAGTGSDDAPQAAGGGSAKSEVTSSDDFWASLRQELESRMKLMLPEPAKAAAAAPAPALASVPAIPAIPLPGVPLPSIAKGGGADAAGAATAPGAASGTPAAQKGAEPKTLNATAPADKAPALPSNDGILSYASKQVGTFALNPETGAVTVQAPHWVLADLDSYFKRVQSMYNTDITFQGELIMLSTDTARSEGLDISSFARFANAKYGVMYRNNGLGGVTLSFPTPGGVPSVTNGAGALTGPSLGLVGLGDGLQIFNSYLTNSGRVTTLQRPILTTTSGVPADFRRTVTKYFNTVSQEAASGGASGGAAVGTTNQLIPQEFGTVLRVNPRMDMSTGLIRAQIELIQTSQSGTQMVAQSVSSDGAVEQVNTQLPVVSRMVYSGEALLRDGDLVVMGGQTEDMENSSREGVTGLMDSPALGGVFGKNKREANKNVFYFALRVSVNKR